PPTRAGAGHRGLGLGAPSGPAGLDPAIPAGESRRIAAQRGDDTQGTARRRAAARAGRAVRTAPPARRAARTTAAARSAPVAAATGGGATDEPIRSASTRRAHAMAGNRIVVYQGPGKTSVESVDYPTLAIPAEVARDLGIPQAAPHAVILKVVSTNICGSDQHMVRG